MMFRRAEQAEDLGTCPWQVRLVLVIVYFWLMDTSPGQAVEARGSVAEPVRLHIQLGHNEMTSAVFSPDGQWIVTAGANGTAALWNAATGQELRRFEGHTDWVNSAVFSPDGRSVLTASNDQTGRLWDVATGQEVRRFKGHTLDVKSAVFAPDGRTILTASFDKTARLWDVATGSELRRFEDHANLVATAVFSPDGRTILTANFDKTARLWDVATGQELRRFGVPSLRSVIDGSPAQAIMARLNKIPVPYARFAPDGQMILTININILSSEPDITADLWDVATGQERRHFTGHTGVLLSAVFSNDGRTILTTSSDKTACLWDVATGQELRCFAGYAGLGSAVFAPDGRRVLIASGTTASLWDVATGEELRRFEGRSRSINSAVFTFDKHAVLTASSDKTARLWGVATGQELRRFEGHTDQVNSAVFAPDGRTILTASFDNTARLWDVATGQELRRFEGDTEVNSAVFAPDGGRILTSSFFRACLWDATSGHELRCFKHKKGVMTHAVFDPSGRKVLIASETTARLWDATTGEELRRFEGHTSSVKSAVFDPKGQWVLTASADRTARLWDAATGQELRRFEGVASAVFAPGGQTILTTGSDGMKRLWDTATGQELRRSEGDSSDTNDAVFVPDGRWILIAGGNSIRFWDVQTGQERARLVSFIDGTWVVATPDGRFDTNNLEEIKGLHWIMGDDPLRALPLEIFMRDYYEPRLLPRVLAGEPLPAIRSLTDLNRAQPTVQIIGVDRERDAQGRSSDTVAVTVQVAGASDAFGLEGQRRYMETGAYDLRLFRDGQLVGQWPEGGNQATTVGLSADELQQWRQERRVVDRNEGARQIVFKGIRLPRREGMNEVQFSAYAFNDDRVKSETARKPFAIPSELRPRRPRAYLVSVGVNVFEDNRWDLSYAANDAIQLGEVLTVRLQAQRDAQGQPRYEQVVWVGLTAEGHVDQDGTRQMTKIQTRKAQIAAVLKTLAGHPVQPDVLQGIEHAEQLRRANPEDLVIIALSTHGEVDPRGQFYLLPHDIGINSTESVRRARAISNDELSEWLHGLDVIDLVMIIDACHSAASVQNKEFKPGPMGSRGLGQLAYDKGMRILAATQIDQYALETQKTQLGLLSYALVREGLEQQKADYKPKDEQIWLSEWLSYASERVPGLYADLRTGKLKARHALPLDEPHENVRSLQRPALFDFARGRDLPLMLGVGQ